eukprot:jgi/Mesvir1/20772/Mv07890-RA.1
MRFRWHVNLLHGIMWCDGQDNIPSLEQIMRKMFTCARVAGDFHDDTKHFLKIDEIDFCQFQLCSEVGPGAACTALLEQQASDGGQLRVLVDVRVYNPNRVDVEIEHLDAVATDVPEGVQMLTCELADGSNKELHKRSHAALVLSCLVELEDPFAQVVSDFLNKKDVSVAIVARAKAKAMITIRRTFRYNKTFNEDNIGSVLGSQDESCPVSVDIGYQLPSVYSCGTQQSRAELDSILACLGPLGLGLATGACNDELAVVEVLQRVVVRNPSPFRITLTGLNVRVSDDQGRYLGQGTIPHPIDISPYAYTELYVVVQLDNLLSLSITVLQRLLDVLLGRLSVGIEGTMSTRVLTMDLPPLVLPPTQLMTPISIVDILNLVFSFAEGDSSILRDCNDCIFGCD